MRSRIDTQWVEQLWARETKQGQMVSFVGKTFGPLTPREEQILRAGFSLGAYTAAEDFCGSDIVQRDIVEPDKPVYRRRHLTTEY